MRDRDDWEVWDDRRPDEPPAEEPPRRGKGWVIALVVGSVLILGAFGVGLYFLMDDDGPPPMAFAPPPGGFGPGGFGPPGVPGLPGGAIDTEPPDADTRKQILAAIQALGKALRKPDFDPDDHFALDRLASAGRATVPTDLNWGNRFHFPDPGDTPPDAATATKQVLRAHRSKWRRYDWATADVRFMHVSVGPVRLVRAVVWFKCPDGSTLKSLLTFTQEGGADGIAWKVSDWEDMTTGVGLSHEIALSLIQQSEQRDLQPYQRLAHLHRLIETGESEAAEEILNSLARLRPVGEFLALSELAEAKFQVRLGNPRGAAQTVERVRDRGADMIALSPIRVEARYRIADHDEVLNIADHFRKHYGDDPDVTAYQAASLLALKRPDEARPLVTAALAADPDHPAALDTFRKLHRDDPEQFLRKAMSSKRFPDLFPKLVQSAEMERDWPAVVGLAEEFVARRPDDPAGPTALVRGLAETEDFAAAVRVCERFASQLTEEHREAMSQQLVFVAVRQKKTDELYGLLPDSLVDEFFLAMSREFAYPLITSGERQVGWEKKRWQALDALVSAHAKRRPGAAVVRLYDGHRLMREKKWAEAEKILTAALATNPESGLAFRLRSARWDALYEQKKWSEGVTDVKSSRAALDHFARRCEDDKRWDDLRAVLAAGKTAKVESPYWSGTLLAQEGQHAAAAELFKKVLDEKEPKGILPDIDQYYEMRYDAVGRYVRSAVKAGKAADAVKRLEEEDFAPPMLFAFAVATAGDRERAARYVIQLAEENRGIVGALYADPDLGPLLAKEEFDDFRARFPREERPGVRPGSE